MDFRFVKIDSEKELRIARNYLPVNHLGYPNFDYWLDKVCIPEIESGWKNCILGFSNGYPIAIAIYQQHKEFPRTRHFKTLRVDNKYRGRDIGHFSLRQVEEENKEEFDRIILDVPSNLTDVVRFLEWNGYKKIAGFDLYNINRIDYIMLKEFRKDPSFISKDLWLDPTKIYRVY